MPSTYSNLKIQLMATGENNTTWGDTTNTNLGTALEEAIVGSADVTFASGNVTLTLTDTNTTQTARNMRLRCTGTTGGSTRNLVVPSIEKPYIVQNDCADSILVKTAAGTGVTVPAGKTMWVFSDGTNVVDVVTHLSSLSLGGTLTGTSANFSGIVNAGSEIRTGTGVSTAGVGLEVGSLRSGSGDSYIDLHATTGVDFSARIIRYGGANGGMDILTTGAGGMTLSTGGAGDVVIQTSSTERMRVTNLGNVGIGTSSPADRLNVSDGTANIQLKPVGGSNIGYVGLRSNHALGFTTNDTEQMRITSAGNVGIGTTSPATKLAVTGAVSVTENFFTGGNSGVWFNGANNFSLGVYSTNSSADVAIATSNTERMRVTSAGLVGIGTTSPGVSLQVNGGIRARGGAPGALGVNNNGYAFSGSGDTDGGMFSSADGQIEFYTNSVEQLRITGTGGITSASVADAVGYKGLPQNSQAGAYTLTLADMGKHVSNTTGGFVVPANGSVAFPVGATIVLFNNSGSTQTVSITTDTLRQAGTTNTGTRTLAVYGVATCIKVASTTWVISGNVA